MKPSRDIRDLLSIMARLREPDGGCPWDVEQDFASIAPYTIEEAYEVADAIERGDLDDLKDELGDLLLQVVFHAQMAGEQDAFQFADVVEAITAKLIRRHPHVFGDSQTDDSAVVKARWEVIKAEEKAERGKRHGQGQGPDEASILDDIPAALPALTRAEKLQKRAAKVGFDWDEPRAVIAKLREEILEIESELGEDASSDRLEDELGDLLFAVVNLCRHLSVAPESALRRANGKFVRRFSYIESELARHGRSPVDASLDEMEALWTEAKRLPRRA